MNANRQLDGLTRRGFLGGAAALATGMMMPVSAEATRSSRIRLKLPAPTGPHDIGTVSLHLVDHARRDPWLPTPKARELMVTVWYPALGVGRGDLAPWMTSGALAHYRPELTAFLQPSDLPPPPPKVAAAATTGKVSLEGVVFPTTHARQGAPVMPSRRPYPVVLFSPGMGIGRELGTTLVEDLASHGYVVVTIGHTYDAAEVEFPCRRVELGRHDIDNTPHLAMIRRRADTRFVLDELEALASGANPDAEHRRLPVGLRRCLDLRKIGMFGHSIGGAATAQTMANDKRIIAGVSLDGSIFPDVDPLVVGPDVVDQELKLLANRIGSRPFLMMGSGGFGPDYFGNLVSSFWHGLHGWRRFLSIKWSTHFTYTDLTPLLAQLEAAGVIPSAAPLVGEKPERTIAAQRAYIRAFFDLSLRGRRSHLLDAPSTAYPEVVFYPPA